MCDQFLWKIGFQQNYEQLRPGQENKQQIEYFKVDSDSNATASDSDARWCHFDVDKSSRSASQAKPSIIVDAK